MPALLLVTDLTYEAAGRRYCDEDIALAESLRTSWEVALTSPRQAARLVDRFDAVLVRNSGPVTGYRREYQAFRRRVAETGVPVYNPLDARADMAGKGYLVDLTKAGAAVVPTADHLDAARLLADGGDCILKPVDGADSQGLRRVSAADLESADLTGMIVQPVVDFRYEVSFVFVDDTFHYALYAPDPERRWELEVYEPSPQDLRFARHFIEWSGLPHGVQRVDACRTAGGELLLMELEDHNPYLSLLALPDGTREAFLTDLTRSLGRLAQEGRAGRAASSRG
ncbi:RimK family alpha-L-glutamate ligase [Streptomyces sp. NPDC088785]|uniref:ATP-grasp domain-containing protein n=1 Tax=Streptomyces sp. NPDC088785 TaxID=3365897 RepID=UPI0037F8FFF1